MRLPISLTLVSLAALASPALAQKDAPDAQKQHAEKVAEAVAANWASAPVEEGWMARASPIPRRRAR